MDLFYVAETQLRKNTLYSRRGPNLYHIISTWKMKDLVYSSRKQTVKYKYDKPTLASRPILQHSSSYGEQVYAGMTDSS